MRLIDADVLKDKFKAHYDLFVGDYKGEHMSLSDKLRVDEILNSMAEVINAPTVCDIEQIRADIEAARYGLINDGLDVALRIIDKHVEGR